MREDFILWILLLRTQLHSHSEYQKESSVTFQQRKEEKTHHGIYQKNSPLEETLEEFEPLKVCPQVKLFIQSLT